jgi:hypothetical protein
MVVVAHQARGVDYPVEPLSSAREYFQEQFPILFLQKNILPTVTPRGDVVKTMGKFNSERTRHQTIISETGEKAKDKT